MSVRARIDMLEVDDERSGSNGHGGGGRRAFGLDLKRWRRETSDCAQKDTVEADDERSDSKGRGWSVRRAIGFEMTRWRQETSGGDRMDTVWAGDEWVTKGNEQRPCDTHGKIFVKSTAY